MVEPWVFRYTAPDGRRREKGLGTCHRNSAADAGLSATEAREAAELARKDLAAGRDPIDHQRALKRTSVKRFLTTQSFVRSCAPNPTSKSPAYRSHNLCLASTAALFAGLVSTVFLYSIGARGKAPRGSATNSRPCYSAAAGFRSRIFAVENTLAVKWRFARFSHRKSKLCAICS